MHFKAAVNYINSGAFQEAINVLNGIDNRDGRWYYYSAQANSGAGNTATALEHAKHAVEIDPDNVAESLQTASKRWTMVCRKRTVIWQNYYESGRILHDAFMP